jgi:hypothetical protein
MATAGKKIKSELKSLFSSLMSARLPDTMAAQLAEAGVKPDAEGKATAKELQDKVPAPLAKALGKMFFEGLVEILGKVSDAAQEVRNTKEYWMKTTDSR